MAKKIKKSDWPVGEKITVLDPDSAFPEPCIKVASVYLPVASFSKGAKILNDKGFLAFAQYQADEMEKIARNLMAKKSNDRGMITDAKDVLSIVARLRGAIARGDIGEACCDGIALGRFSERLRLRIHSFDNHILKENKRIAGKKKNNKDRKTLSQNKRTKCREKFAEFTPEEKKDLGLEKTYEEVGELVQQSLKLSEPIPGNTVRRYISKK